MLELYRIEMLIVYNSINLLGLYLVINYGNVDIVEIIFNLLLEIGYEGLFLKKNFMYILEVKDKNGFFGLFLVILRKDKNVVILILNVLFKLVVIYYLDNE